MKKFLKILFRFHQDKTSNYKIACENLINIREKLDFRDIYYKPIIVNNYKPIYINELHL